MLIPSGPERRAQSGRSAADYPAHFVVIGIQGHCGSCTSTLSNSALQTPLTVDSITSMFPFTVWTYSCATCVHSKLSTSGCLDTLTPKGSFTPTVAQTKRKCLWTAFYFTQLMKFPFINYTRALINHNNNHPLIPALLDINVKEDCVWQNQSQNSD